MPEPVSVALDAFTRIYPFRLMPEEARVALAQHATVLKIDKDSLVYQQDGEALALYLLVHGEVELYLDPAGGSEQAETLGVLHSGDLFGFEVMDRRTFFRTNAMAVNGALILRIDEQPLLDVLKTYPSINQPLQLMLDSFLLSLRVGLPWRESDEAVIYIARRHPVFLWFRLLPALFIFLVGTLMLAYLVLANLPGSITPGLGAGAASLLGGFWTIWIFIDWGNDYSILTSRRVVFQERVVFFYDSRQEAPLQTVLADTIRSSQIGRILGYGDLVLKTYTGTIILPAISHPEMVSIIVHDQRALMQATTRQKDLGAVQQAVKQRIFHEPGSPGSATEPTGIGRPGVDPITTGTQPTGAYTQSRATEHLANLLRMRMEEGGIITYRQHWLVLVRQVFFPLVLIGALSVLSATGALSAFIKLSIQALIGLGLLVGAGLLFWLWYQYEDWANDRFILTADQLVDIYKKPLGEEEKRTASLKNIQSVEFEKLGIIRLLLNYGTVFIRIGDTQFTFDNVYDPSDVQREIFRRLDALNFREKKKETDADREEILDILQAYDELKKENDRKG